MLKAAYKKELLRIIGKHLPDAQIYLFGSRARGDNKETSDIDLAISIGSPIPFSMLMKIGAEIDETTIPMTVDLVDLFSACELLKQTIVKEGVLWTV